MRWCDLRPSVAHWIVNVQVLRSTEVIKLSCGDCCGVVVYRDGDRMSGSPRVGSWIVNIHRVGGRTLRVQSGDHVDLAVQNGGRELLPLGRHESETLPLPAARLCLAYRRQQKPDDQTARKRLHTRDFSRVVTLVGDGTVSSRFMTVFS